MQSLWDTPTPSYFPPDRKSHKPRDGKTQLLLQFSAAATAATSQVSPKQKGREEMPDQYTLHTIAYRDGLDITIAQ